MTNKLSRRCKPASKHFHKSSLAEAVSAAIIATIIATPVFAEETEDDNQDENVILVTATKRSQSIQETPLAITALTGEFIEEVHLTNVKDLIAYSPGVNGDGGGSFLDSVSIRGVRTDDYGAGGDYSVGIFKNDLYEGRAGSAVSTLFDMDRAEIINGPQGFLFGRNAIGGAISIHTRQADLDNTDKTVDLDIGEYNLVKLNATANVIVSDDFAMRFAVVSHNEDSYITNHNPDAEIPPVDVKAIRWSTTYEKDKFRLTTVAEYEDRKMAGVAYRPIEEGAFWEAYDANWGVEVRGDEREVDTNPEWGHKDDTKILNLQFKVEQEFDFADLTVNGGYKDYDYFYSEQWIPASHTNHAAWAVDSEGDYSQLEVRLSSNGDGPLSWYAGASYYNESLQYNTLNTTGHEFMCQYYNYYMNNYYAGYFPGLSSSPTGHCQNYANNWANYTGYPVSYYDYLTDYTNQSAREDSYVDATNKGYAAYLNLAYQVTETVDVEFGIRYTSDKKDFQNNYTSTGLTVGGFYEYGVITDPANPPKNSDTWSNTSLKSLVRWTPTDERMFYFSFTEGYKSGGFSTYSVDLKNGAGAWAIGELATNDNVNISSFKPESIDSYELGYKDTWFEDTNVSVTYYHYDFRDLQLTGGDPDSGSVKIRNIGKVIGDGIEFSSFSALSENWSLMIQYSLFQSDATGVWEECGYGSIEHVPGDPSRGYEECEGSKLPWAPENSGAAVLDGDFPLESGGSVTVSLETYFESSHGGGFDMSHPAGRAIVGETLVDASQTWAARVGYVSDSNWYVEAYVDNLTDEVNFDSTYNGGLDSDFGAYPSVRWSVSKPRTFGVRMGMLWD